MFSHTAEYALRAMVWLAHHPDCPQTTSQVAEATRVPAGYLAKVMQALARGGLVHAQRGMHGGFTLARPSNDITLLDVVNLVDPISRITQCPLGIPAHDHCLCPLHRQLDDTLALIEQRFARLTLSDLLRDQQQPEVKPLCEPPAPDTAAPRQRGAAQRDDTQSRR